MHSTSILPSKPRGSLKSSSSYAQEYKQLKRTDPDLHEASKRFVETMADCRATQFANLQHFHRRVTGEKGYLLPARGRVGYLLFRPKQPIVWLDEQLKVSFHIGMRVSSSVTNQTSVMIASLDRSENTLWLEDLWMIKGELLIGKPFSQRWKRLLTTMEHDSIEDDVLQNGLQIVCATYSPIVSWKEMVSNEEWIHWMPEDASQKRLRIQLTPSSSPPPRPNPNAPQPPRPNPNAPQPLRPNPNAPQAKPQPLVRKETNRPSRVRTLLVARAIPHPTLPDTYTLFTSDEIEKGHAAVQQFTLSQELKQHQTNLKEILVTVKWNEDFLRWQITGIAKGSDLSSGACSSEDFDAFMQKKDV